MYTKKGLFFIAIAAITAGVGLAAVVVSAESASSAGSTGSGNGVSGSVRMMPPIAPAITDAIANLKINLPNRNLSGKIASIDGGIVTIKIDTTDIAKELAVGDSVMIINMPKTANAGGTSEGSKPGLENTNKPKDGQDILNGTITVASDTSLTVKDSKGTEYIVDVTQAKFYKVGNKNVTAADLKVGDRVMIRGNVNGTAVTATMVTDIGTLTQKLPLDIKTDVKQSVVNRIGSFFKNIFNKNK